MKTGQQVVAFGAMLLLTLNVAGIANAQSGFIPGNSGNPGGIPIPIADFNPALSNDGNTIISTVNITSGAVAAIDNGGTISNVFFTIEGLTHSHVSDLTVRVTHLESNRTATLFERVGITDDGTDVGSNGIVDNQNGDGFGANSNFSGTYRFQDGGDSLFAVASGTADNAIVPTLVTSATPQLPVYAASGANNGLVNLLNAFGTDGNGNALSLPDIVGTYQFEISDRSNQTTNTPVAPAGIQSFTRTNVAFQAAVGNGTPVIPEPGSATAMLLGLIGLAARRRKA